MQKEPEAAPQVSPDDGRSPVIQEHIAPATSSATIMLRQLSAPCQILPLQIAADQKNLITTLHMTKL